MLNIATAIANHRWASKQSLRQFGAELGVPAATLMRVEQGYATDTATVAKLVRWLFSENAQEARRSPAHAKRMGSGRKDGKR